MGELELVWHRMVIMHTASACIPAYLMLIQCVVPFFDLAVLFLLLGSFNFDYLTPHAIDHGKARENSVVLGGASASINLST